MIHVCKDELYVALPFGETAGLRLIVTTDAAPLVAERAGRRVELVCRRGHVRRKLRPSWDDADRMAQERSRVSVAGLAEAVADGLCQHPRLDHSADCKKARRSRREEPPPIGGSRWIDHPSRHKPYRTARPPLRDDPTWRRSTGATRRRPGWPGS
jgi:hypothetical protein